MLPFYMNLQFKDVRMSPVFHAMLPPSSFVRGQEDPLSGSVADSSTKQLPIDIGKMLLLEPHNAHMEVTSDVEGQLHLNQTLNTILSCKEAIWEQFEVCSIHVPFP